jgi:hypothetical protein
MMATLVPTAAAAASLCDSSQLSPQPFISVANNASFHAMVGNFAHYQARAAFHYQRPDQDNNVGNGWPTRQRFSICLVVKHCCGKDGY